MCLEGCILVNHNTTVDSQSENNSVSQFLIDALYTSVWSWCGADPVLSLTVYVTGSSYAVVLIAASLWNDVFFSPYSFSDFQKLF